LTARAEQKRPTRESLRLALWDAVYRARFEVDQAYEREWELQRVRSGPFRCMREVEEARARLEALLARVPLIDPTYVDSEALRCAKCGAPPGACDLDDGGLCHRRVA
jgi:hypothetical protein